MVKTVNFILHVFHHKFLKCDKKDKTKQKL